MSEMLDEGTGDDSNLSTEYPKTVRGFKDLFKKLDIECENLKGIRSFKMKYDEYINEVEGDSDDTEDLDEDASGFDTIAYEGVDYLEDENTAKIYNTKHIHVGSWNCDCDDIIWVSDEFRDQHDTARA